MSVRTGDRVTITLPNGTRWPGIAVSHAESKPHTVISNATKLPTEIEVSRFKVITLRETLPNDAGEVKTYLHLSVEVDEFGFSPKAEPRFDRIVGLDVEEDGALITLQELMERRGADYSEFQSRNFEARNGATAAADL